MTFEAPDGWKVKSVPFRLDLKAAKVLGSIMAIDEFTFDLLQLQREQTARRHQPGIQETTDASDITIEQCRGKKYLYRLMSPAQLKRVDYVLSVPGGFVNISLGTMGGTDFDEMPLEAKLHTLRLSASA
jgi:hypothetical protein